MQKSDERKQFGKYCGPLLEKDKDSIKDWSEPKVFTTLQCLGSIVFRLQHDMADGRIEEDLDLTPYQYAMEYLALQTSRFGVQIEEPKEGEHVLTTKSYLAWYDWWYNYLDFSLSDDEWKDFKKRLENDEDVSMYRPEGDWKNREKENSFYAGLQ